MTTISTDATQEVVEHGESDFLKLLKKLEAS